MEWSALEDACAVRTSSQSFERAEENERDVMGVNLKCERGTEREEDFFAREPFDRRISKQPRAS